MRWDKIFYTRVNSQNAMGFVLGCLIASVMLSDDSSARIHGIVSKKLFFSHFFDFCSDGLGLIVLWLVKLDL